MRLLVLLILIISTSFSCAQASDLDLGGVIVRVQPPDGYKEVTKEMGSTYEYVMSVAPETNLILTAFIPDNDAKLALKAPQSTQFSARKITLQIGKHAIGRDVTQHDLEIIKHMIVDQNRYQLEALQERAKAALGRALEVAGDHTDAKLGLSLQRFIPLSIHDESPLHFTYSALLNAETLVGEQKINSEVATTATMMVVKKRMLMLFMSADASELEVERKTHKSLVNSILEKIGETTMQTNGKP